MPQPAAGPSWSPDPQSGIEIGLIDAGGRKFEIAASGSGDHLALCLHGFPELNFSWRHQMPVLAAMGYRVWAPNLRGYGASYRPEGAASYRMDALLSDISAIIDASGCRRVTLIAHDWGGALAWMFAMRKLRPLEHLVVMNFPHPACFARELGHWRQRLKSWYIAFFQLPRLPEIWLRKSIRSVFRGMAVDKARFPDSVLDVYQAAVERRGAASAMINWYRAAWRYRAASSGPARVDVPTLLIWGERDRALGIECIDGTDQYVDDLVIRRVAQASHWVQQDAPELVNGILEQWLPRPAGGSAP